MLSIRDILEGIGELILIAVVIGAIILGIGFVVNVVQGFPEYHYEYVDIDGESEVADYCYMNRGNMFCRSGDTTIQVQSYTRIRDN